jgi:hypothetical protein
MTVVRRAHGATVASVATEDIVTITSTTCRVTGATVARLIDLEGHVERIICPYYEDSSRTCRLRAEAVSGGPLGQLLERVAEDTLASPGILCELAA